MGSFDVFKKKVIVEQPSSKSESSIAKTNEANSTDYIDDITFIQEMKHIQAGPWHQYDVLLASQIYSWDFMIKWADYMGTVDLENISEVTVGELGGSTNNITESFIKNGYKLSSLPEVSTERGMLSVAGISNALKAPTKIVWVNQTRVLRIFTLINDEFIIKKYSESMARWNFGTENAMKIGKPIPDGQ